MRLELPGARVESSSDGQTFLFEERYGFVYLLDAAGALLVEQLLSAEQSLASLMAAVADSFDVPPGTDVAGDVEAFLTRLRDYGLLA